MFVTEDGIVTDTSDGQSANAHSPSDLTEEGITTETNAVPQKVLYPIVSTWSRFTDFRDEQELNAPYRLFIEDGNVTSVTLVLLLNAYDTDVTSYVCVTVLVRGFPSSSYFTLPFEP